ncbi:MAG: cytochrome c biogenesis protein CcsA [Candidatus Cryptobacteroides sp.]
MKNLPKYLSFGTLALLVAMMMAATVIEKAEGSPAAFSAVYHHPLFILLWSVAAISGIVWLCRRGVVRKSFTFSLHLSFVLILAGALTTFLCGEKGSIHLRVGEQGDSIVLEGGGTKSLPFSLRLDEYAVECYPGSKAAADYRSTVTVLPEGTEHCISMNHILRHKGYRFYQADFDEDLGGSTLAVSHDPWGIAVTYTGYVLLLLSILGFFFQKGTAYRAALERLAPVAVILAGLTVPTSLDARNLRCERPEVLPEEVAEAFGDLYVYYNERVCPLSTLNRSYCLKAYGKAGPFGFTADQTVSGWLFYYDWWRVVPFKVKAKDRGTAREDELEYLQRSAASGDAFKIFPIRSSDGTVSWYGCNDPLPEEVTDNYDLWVFVRKALDLVDESVRQEDWDEVLRLVGKIKAYQEKTAAEVLPSALKVKAERLYNSISRPMIPFMSSITIGIILFILCGALMARGKRLPSPVQHVTACLTALLWCYLTLVLGLRWFVSGHAPFSGSYCVMMLMAWLSSLSSLLLYRKFPLILPTGLLLAGFTMLMASLASASPQITRLMPVLQSPLLSIHVLSMMLSYTLLGLVALCGILGLCMPTQDQAAKLKDLSTTVLCPAVFLLAFGTFLGAVWANISWGSYWGWDPKETWALVTLLVYSFALHGGSLEIFRRPKFFHAYCIIAFLSVLVTYFGVNLILGGMHSYA